MENKEKYYKALINNDGQLNEIDPLFSTYYDYKVARIIANELLYTYILQKINNDEMAGSLSARDISFDGILWTDTKNALIELIYALYANGPLSCCSKIAILLAPPQISSQLLCTLSISSSRSVRCSIMSNQLSILFYGKTSKKILATGWLLKS